MTLVERLRAWSSTVSEEILYLEAADRLERYEAALREIAAMEPETRGEVAADEKVRIARKALGEV